MSSRAFRENYREIEWRPLARSEPPREIRPARSDFPAPRLIRDVMDPVQSQASGKWYDSKSGIRAEYKRLGVQEVGNDPARLRPKKREKRDPKVYHDAVEKATARFDRGERALKKSWAKVQD